MSVSIERATRADLPEIVAILAADRLLGERDTTDPSVLPVYEEAFEAVSADPNLALYVARREGRVLGTFLLVVFPVLVRRGARIGVLEQVQVHPEARGSGIGSAMVTFAIAEARRRGANSLQVATNKKRLDAQRFYERLGFERRHEGFKLDLGGPA
ncbi:GNAT family N-acetyltransferase [Ancylobacter mangrovi]|uniref:GNAT family N-acetyltransferase n=1 Tax=Ancylobacter mangrovi TaxID=2972472 RepID=UPI002161915E|nr:GNAT family N-acetyltransferase [Ancylobacter mangrovi]MCS0505286.1 GNAT family N-acetyltransferase [Ancylobacter mangrovi]